MTTAEIKSTLATGVVKFIFTKKDGTERHATGTRNVDVIAENNATPKGNEPAAGVVCYFDVDKGAWRSFKEENFVRFLEPGEEFPIVDAA